jgi:2-polyprenyl-3-methyl-5-hydroxy-6-metoxy-1,4-benzoquinol methylase
MNDKKKELQEFYENYRRSQDILPIISKDHFMYSNIIKQISPHLKPGMKILDLGCNDGVLSIYMANLGCDVFGIDISNNAIECANSNRDYHRLFNAHFEAMDFISEWKDPEIFDLVLCSFVIEHVIHDDLFLEKIFYSLKNSGKLVIFCPTSYSSVFRLSKLITGKFVVDEEEGHLRRYTKESFQRLIQASGFQIDKTLFFDSLIRDWFIVYKPLRRLNQIFYLKYVRNIVNSVDNFFAKIGLFPASICIQASKKK